VLGVGYAILSCQKMGATIDVVIFHDGCAGYSDANQKDIIIETRKQETMNALAALGIDESHVHRYEIPDFSSMNYLYWKGPGRSEGDSIFEKSLRLLRQLNCTRLFLPNGYHEHPDHCAASLSGLFDGVQACDPVLVDWGNPIHIKSFFMYSVWGAFSPMEEAEATTFTIGVSSVIEDRIRTALAQWESQQEIIKGIMVERESRLISEKNQYVEIYLNIIPRPKLDLEKYKDVIRGL
jgi:hypothetical protein